MTVTLESLELAPQELECCRDAVHTMAYFNWLDAGCPQDGQLDFWLRAERDWIENCYVPSRPCDGTRPETTPAAAAAAGGDTANVQKPKGSRRREKATA
jgi:hypothetical protein